jgi:hypothetical protein
MRSILLAAMAFVVADVCRAEDTPRATGIMAGKKVVFPDKAVADGVKATLGLLESCTSESLYEADELKKAEQADHIRLVFAKPITATVMEEKVAFSELVFRLPLNTGVFWLRSGDKVRRYSKYAPQKERPFVVWLREAQAAD